MKGQPGLCAIALAVLIVGLVAVGVPASTQQVAALVLTSPPMILVVMRSTHGGYTIEYHDPAPHLAD